MFVINGNPTAWSVETGEKSFVVKNSTGNVSFTVNDEKYQDTLDASWDMNGGIIRKDIYPGSTVVRYDNKTMVPEAFACEGKKGSAILAAVSINVKPGYRITSVYNNFTPVYSRECDPEKFLDFIANFAVTKGEKPIMPHISVTMVNNEKKRILSYVVNYDKKLNQVKISMQQISFDQNPKKGVRGHVNTFDFVGKTLANGGDVLPVYFPSSPTHVILTASQTLGELKNLIDSKTRWRPYDKYGIVERATEEEVQRISDEGYKAISIFTNAQLTFKDIDDGNWKEYVFGLGDKILELFDTIYLVNSDGKILKLKLMGTLNVR